jgi:hypothetical protein
MYRLVPCLALALTAGLAAAADETYTIKVQDFPPQGESVKVSVNESKTETVKVADENGKVVNNQKKMAGKIDVYTDKSIKVEGDKRVKYQRAYEKAIEKVGKEEQKLPHHGRTILFERVKGKYVVSAEGEPKLEEKDLAELTKEANKDTGDKLREVMLPKKAVKVGDKWPLPEKQLTKLFEGLPFETDALKGEGKLVKAYKKDGKQFGVLEFTISFDNKKDGKKLGSSEFVMNLDTAIDGSSTTGTMTVKAKFTVKQQVEQNGMKFQVDALVEADSKTERTAVK